jgi:hypothetical protein
MITYMSTLHELIDDGSIANLSGAEFKVAACLYRLLERRSPLTIRIEDVSRATGVSWRQTQAALQSLARKGVLVIARGGGRGARYSLPAQRPALAQPQPPQGGADPPPAVAARAATGSPIDADIAALLAAVYKQPDAAEMRELEQAAGGKRQLRACLREFRDTEKCFEPTNRNLFRSAVIFQCQNVRAGR